MVSPVRFPSVNIVQGPSTTEVRAPARGEKAEPGAGFEKMVGDALERVDGAAKQADQTIGDFLQGKAGIHEMALSLEQADLSLRMLTRIRNRVIEAYKEISRMNV